MKTYETSQLRNTAIKDYKEGSEVFIEKDAELIPFMISTIKNAAENANNHLKLKFQLIEKGII